MKKLLTRFCHDESGATAIEYGLIAGMIAIAIIGVITSLGTTLNTVFSTVKDGLHS
jgi:pilus assembly protein Flp/PilA